MFKKITRTFIFGAIALVVALSASMIWSAPAMASEPFLAEIRMFGFTFAPRGWADCNGQILPINQNQSLYSLLGTTYGGDGRTNFALPDLRGRFPMHEGASPGGTQHNLGQKSGSETNTLTATEMPSHTHDATARAYSGYASTELPQNQVWAKAPRMLKYSTTAPDVTMRSGAVTLASAGASQALNNMPPFIAVRYCIALQGVFPSRN